MGTLLVANAMARQLRDAAAGGSIVTISSTTTYEGWATRLTTGWRRPRSAADPEPRDRVGAVRHPGQHCGAGHTLAPMVQEMIDQGLDVAATRARARLGRLATLDEMAGGD